MKSLFLAAAISVFLVSTAMGQSTGVTGGTGVSGGSGQGFTTPPFVVPTSGPPVVIDCVKALNSAYVARAYNIKHNGDPIGQNNQPSKLSCLGNLMQGMMVGWPSIDLSSILSELENMACNALTSVINSQMSALGSTVQLPGGLGTVSVLPSYNNGANTSTNDVSGNVGATIWNMGPGQIPPPQPIQNPINGGTIGGP